MIVRHPLERLLSAYLDKLVKITNSTRHLKWNYGRTMMAFARKIPRDETPLDGIGLTFNEFLYYLSRHKTIEYQEHWRPMHQLCHPCLIQYDFIAKFETIEKDSNEILTRLGIDDPTIRYPKQVPSETASLLKELSNSLNALVMKKLYKKYEPDYKLFEYNKTYS